MILGLLGVFFVVFLVYVGKVDVYEGNDDMIFFELVDLSMFVVFMI